MIKTLLKSFEIENAYTINSYIFILRKLPILKDLLTDDAYSSVTLKKIISVFCILFTFFTKAFLKFMYYFTIFFICYKLFPNNFIKSYFHMYFFLTLLGMFINNKLLNTNKKNYFSIILFNMDATKYFQATCFSNTVINFILNSAYIILFNHILMTPNIIYSIILILYTTFIRFIGETLNILYYRKYKYIWYSNSTLYFIVLVSTLGLASLPLLNIYISFNTIILSTILVVILGTMSLIYLLKIKDYKTIYKNLSQMTNVMSSKNEKDYLKQAMVDVQKKDIKIPERKLKGKSGYEYFNTIFFERHKEILLRSTKKYSLILIAIYIILIYLVIKKPTITKAISDLLHNRLSIFIIIMYFINRGAIITQAMFFNCDHAMLNYNFYKEPKTIIELFKKRLKTVTKVNLLPAFVIGIGNIILLILLKETDIIVLLSMFIFIIFLSIFFSVHYLVIYYLLQPFNKDLEVKKTSYSFVTLITYILCYNLIDLVLDIKVLSILGIIFTGVYILISMALVYKVAPKTFKLN